MASDNQGSSVAASLASMVGINTASGTVANPTNSGRQGAGSGVKVGAPAGTGGAQRLPAANVGAQARGP